MIDLIYHHESVFVYNVEDWDLLRKKYRIIGELFGSTQYVPALPLKLLPEEALLLIDKQIGKLVTYEESTTTTEQHDKFTEALIATELIQYKEIRRKQVELYIDKIVAGKRKKGDTRTQEDILQEEVNKVEVNETNMIWPLILHNFNKETLTYIGNEVLLSQTTPVKYETFKDLWERKYYITTGTKFGGDFLVYNGDPILYHAHYIVRCLENDEKLFPTELVALGRVCTSVKKKGLLSSLQNDIINYITINWIDQ